MSSRLLLVDDHPLFCEGFATMIVKSRGDWRLETADSAASGCAALSAHPDLDLVIVDIQLPDRDGFAAIADMAQLRPDVARVMISGRMDMMARHRARKAGASGLIDKSETPERILEMIQTVLDGGVAFDVPARERAPFLTLRQAEVLELLAEGCPNKEMHYRLNIAERTVRAHLTELFSILGASNRVRAIVRARELGLIG